MQKSMLVLAVALLALPAAAAAQSSTVTATATIATAVSMTGGDQTIDVGELSSAGTEILPGGTGAANFVVTYNTNAQVTFSTGQVALTHAHIPAAMITAEFLCGLNSGGSYTSAACDATAPLHLDLVGSSTQTSEVSVGIRIPSFNMADLPAGTYTGNLTITAATRT